MDDPEPTFVLLLQFNMSISHKNASEAITCRRKLFNQTYILRNDSQRCTCFQNRFLVGLTGNVSAIMAWEKRAKIDLKSPLITIIPLSGLRIEPVDDVVIATTQALQETDSQNSQSPFCCVAQNYRFRFHCCHQKGNQRSNQMMFSICCSRLLAFFLCVISSQGHSLKLDRFSIFILQTTLQTSPYKCVFWK